jgi:type I restriction enzyme S subunit
MVVMNLNRYAKGVAQPGISVNVINAVNIILPSLELQQLFAQKIEAIEKQKALIKQSIAETEELFNSRMDYYFS